MSDTPTPDPSPAPQADPASAPTVLAPAPVDPRPAVRRPQLGRVLFAAGALTLPLGVGVGLGFWISDAGVRWIPLVGWLLVGWILGLLIMIGGATLMGPAVGSPKGRKRIFACAMLVLLAAGARLGVAWLNQPGPLAAMGPVEFARTVRDDTARYQALDRQLDGVVRAVRELSVFQGDDPEGVLSGDDEAALVEGWLAYLDLAFSLDQQRVFYEDYYRLDLSRVERGRHLQSFLLTYAAELSLYHHTADLIDLVESRPNVITFLNQARADAGLPADSYAALREELTGVSDLSRVVAGKQYLAYLDRMHRAREEAELLGSGPLWDEVEAHLRQIETRRKRELAALTVTSDVAPLKRTVKHTVFPVQKQVAELMGDVRVRRPGRYLIGDEDLARLLPMLQPGDVLLGRKNWYLSNVGLPGFWPHAMLYVGTNEQLAASLDADPEVLAWVERSCGRPLTFSDYLAQTYPRAWAERLAHADEHPLTVLEAVSEGVLQSTLQHASGDYFAAMRPRLAPWVKAQAIARAFGYLDRPYDFDFDFASDQSLVCSEVVWRAYRPQEGAPGLELPLVQVVGRPTLSPNEMARVYAREHGTPQAQFDFVAFIDAREADQSTFFADEAAFRASGERSKWDFSQE
ncbi:MAG: protein tyrosine phosphatase [Planctomycetes bacterium]|nr:protein tyrosine phosphatase [Planctomycetota bacterium]